MALRTHVPAESVTMRLVNGTEVVFRRIPYLQDAFIDEEGHVIRVISAQQSVLNKRRVTRYAQTSLSLAHLMADTWLPGWDLDPKMTIHFKDGDSMNCRLDNLKPFMADSRPPGRPTNNVFKRTAEAMAVLEASLDLDGTAAECDISREELLSVCRQINNDLADTLLAIESGNGTIKKRPTLRDVIGEPFELVLKTRDHNRKRNDPAQ